MAGWVPPAPRSSLRSTPGGGGIVFLAARGIGVLDPDGVMTTFGRWEAADAYWDPLHRSRILVNPYTGGPPRLREFRRDGSKWREVRRWPTGYGLLSAISPSGTHLAYSVFEHGRQTWTIRVSGRDGSVRDLATDRLEPVSWTPSGRVLLSGWGPRRLEVWHPFHGTVASLDPTWGLREQLPSSARGIDLDVFHLSWSSDGRFFAAPAYWRVDGVSKRAVAVGSSARGVFEVIPTGKADTVPTWSPKASELSYTTANGYPKQSSVLHVYDPSTGQDVVIRRGVPDSWWVAWSPQGDWMLLDDDGQAEWLFVSRHEGTVVRRDRLGSFPRWASPGVDLHIWVC
ncbi:MAG: hypothetical protein ABR518_07995 [Actinomycetota bacterium]